MAKKDTFVDPSNHIKASVGSCVFDVVNTIVLIALCFVTLYPMWYCLCASFTSTSYLSAHQGVLFWPHMFTTSAYRLAFTHPLLLSGYKNILIVLLVSLPINIFLTLFTGYFLASKDVMLKPIIQFLIMFTMFFSGGMIPIFLNIRDLGLYNTLWSLILPGAISVYNCIICRSFFLSIPKEMEESASIDGCSPIGIFFRIILPLSRALLGVMVLYFAVYHWNTYFDAMIYLKDDAKQTLQVFLRRILVLTQQQAQNEEAAGYANTLSQYEALIRYAVIVVSSLPLLIVYPFVQKYFDKGVMIGSVKG